MKRTALVAIVLAVAIAVVGVAFLILKPGGAVTRTTVHSVALGRDMPIEVHFASNADCDATPILILFHGRGGDERQWFEGQLLDGVGIDGIASRLIDARLIKPVTIVAAAIDDSYGVDSVAADDGYDHGAYERYIVDELVPAVEERYGSDGRSPLFVGGLSMGGFAALNAAFRHPGLFDGVGALSPAFFVSPPLDRQWIYSADDGRSLVELVDAGAADGMPLFLGYGDHDYDWIEKATDGLRGKLVDRSQPPDFVAAPGGHDAGTWRTLAESMLKHLLGNDPTNC